VEYSLPYHEGLEVLQNFHCSFPFLPVIVLAEQNNETAAAAATEAGAYDYFAKPSLTRDRLCHAIAKATNYGALQRELARKDAVIQDLRGELALSQERYDLTVRGMNIGIWDWNVATDELYWSDNLKEMIGISDSAFKPHFTEFSDRVHPDDKEPTHRKIMAHLEHRGLFDIELRLRQSNGEYLWMHTYGQAKWDEEGRPVRLAGSAIDISRRKKAEEQREKLVEKLAESNELNNAILSSAVTLLIATDANGIIVMFNSASEKALGYTKDEVVGKLTPAIWHDEAEVVKRAAELSEEYGTTIKPGLETFTYKPRVDGSESREWTFVTKSGSRFPGNLILTAIRNKDGEVAGHLGIIEDITKRKEAEQALKTSEETFRLAIEDASIGMALVAPNGTWLKVNKALSSLLGYTEDELLTCDFQSLTHPDDLEEDLEYVRKVLAGDIKSYQMEKRYFRRSGRLVWALLSVSLVRHANGEPNYFISQIQDITERKEMERIKNEFISVVSHELRTPLTSIRGSLDLLVGTMAKDLPERANRLLNIAQQNSERLILLINDMLDMDKIASGQMRFDMSEEAISPIIQQAVATNQPYANKFGVSFIALPVNAALKVNVDAERLLQVLANLLSNAAKFSSQGDKIEITVVACNKIVRIMVADHGPGIPEEFRTHVFDKFAQADSSVTRVKGGTGLGLHISKQIMERMGGRIGFDAETGKGSTFWVELPTAS